jgi:8-oxo-dGTP pyrophosphatase MutT (NUDIX family)
MERRDPVSIRPQVDVQLRSYRDDDLPILASLNRQLQEAEGRPAPPEPQLIAAQLSLRLASDLDAVLVCVGTEPRGYILFRHEAEALWVAEFWMGAGRDAGQIGSAAFSVFLEREGFNHAHVRVRMPSANRRARAFWKGLGFQDHSVTMDLPTAEKAQLRMSSGAVVVRRQLLGRQRYLLVLQESDETGGFPKGHSRGDEGEQQTALREVEEETGLPIRIVPGFYERASYVTPRGRKKIAGFFIAYPVGGTLSPQKGEIREIRWVSFSDALRLLPNPQLRRVLERARDFVEAAARL